MLATTFAPLLLAPLGGGDLASACAGQGDAQLTVSAAVVGRPLHVELEAEPFSTGFAWIGGKLGPVPLPGGSDACQDVLAPGLFLFSFSVDGDGHVRRTFLSGPDPEVGLLPPAYLTAAVLDSNGTSVSATERLDWIHDAGNELTDGGLGLARAGHTATALEDGRVLITGGGGGDLLFPEGEVDCELFDPLTRTFSPTAPLGEPRTTHTATRLQDGRVLVVGGADSAGVVSDTCEIYDPATGSWSPAASMFFGRVGHTATLLDDGRVLVTGGLATYENAMVDPGPAYASAQAHAELYYPNGNFWVSAANLMVSPRSGHTATLLDDGRVLLFGGINGVIFSAFGSPLPGNTNTADVFDPASDAFSDAGSVPVARSFHAASKLGDGRVLVTGGLVTQTTFLGSIFAVADCDLYDPQAGTWSAASALPVPLAYHTQSARNSRGDALIVGGITDFFPTFQAVSAVGRFDGVSYRAQEDLGVVLGRGVAQPRGVHRTTALPNGMWLVSGGSDLNVPLANGYVLAP
ncbi:MAG: Kelch repeat-containing protein [Planctomycetota bacterium]|jgi:hypothetical protein